MERIGEQAFAVSLARAKVGPISSITTATCLYCFSYCSKSLSWWFSFSISI